MLAVKTRTVKPVHRAIQFGSEDARNGADRRGSLYFYPGSKPWRFYNAAYDRALARPRTRLTVTSARTERN